MNDKETIFEFVEKEYTKSELYDLIDESIYDYVDDSWEDEFDDMWEAYSETGRGEAESDVVNQIILDSQSKLGISLNSNDFGDLMYELSEHFDISLN